MQSAPPGPAASAHGNGAAAASARSRGQPTVTVPATAAAAPATRHHARVSDDTLAAAEAAISAPPSPPAAATAAPAATPPAATAAATEEAHAPLLPAASSDAASDAELPVTTKTVRVVAQPTESAPKRTRTASTARVAAAAAAATAASPTAATPTPAASSSSASSSPKDGAAVAAAPAPAAPTRSGSLWAVRMRRSNDVVRVMTKLQQAVADKPKPKPAWVLHPDSRMYRWWLVICVGVIFANVWSVPFRLSVGYNRIQGDFTAFTATDVLFDLIYFCNIGLKTRMAFYQEGALITEPRLIWAKYFGFDLFVDVFSVVPLDWILLASGHYVESVLMRLTRLVQFLFVARYLSDLETSPGVNVTAVRLGKIVTFYLLLSHLTGCAWFCFALPNHFGDHPWLPSKELLERPYASQYVRVLYWGLATLSDRIESPHPYNSGTLGFIIGTQIIGVLLLAYIIGNIAFAIDDANETFQRFRLQLDYVQRFMTHAKLPLPMQDRVRAYYYYMWATNKGFDDFQMLKDLPSTLRTDVCLQLTASTVGANPLFQGLDVHFLHALVKVLLQRTLVPDEFVIREGEPGSEMYFIRSGIIVITVAVLEPGATSAAAAAAAAAAASATSGHPRSHSLLPRPTAPLGGSGGDLTQQDQTDAKRASSFQNSFRSMTSSARGGAGGANVGGGATGSSGKYLTSTDATTAASSQQSTPPSHSHSHAAKAPLRRQVQTCVDGDLIGEFCVLLPEQCPVRTSSAMALSYCDLFVLRQEDLAQLLSFYPQVQTELEARTMKRRNFVVRKDENIIGLAAASGAGGAGGAQDKVNHKMKQLLGGAGGGGGRGGDADDEAGDGQASAAGPAIKTASGKAVPFGSKQYKILLWLRTYWLTNAPFYEWWMRFIAIISLYNSVCVPFRLSFDFEQAHPALLFVDYSFDACLIFNVFAHLWLRQPPSLGNGLVSSSASAQAQGFVGAVGTFESFGSARKRYLTSGWLLWDVATSLPWDFFMLHTGRMNPWVRFPKVLRVVTDLRVLSNAGLQSAGFDGSTVGLFQLLTGFILLTHWASCAYWSFSYWVGWGDGITEWLPPTMFLEQGRFASYLRAQFESLVLFTGLGMKAPPEGDAEVIYVIIIIIVGILLVGWAVGEVGELIANLDRFNAEFGRQMLATNAFMSYRRFDGRVQKRVRSYLSHWWSTRQGVDPHVAMAGLPVGLRSDIMQFMCEHVLRRVPLFSRLLTADPAGSSFGRQLIERLRFESYPAGEFVFHSGEIGDNMFFITEGEVGIIVPPVATPGAKTAAAARAAHHAHLHAHPTKILGAGSFFGEVALLTNGLRTASIRALRPTFLLVLAKESLWEMMEQHAEFATHMRTLSTERAARLAMVRARQAAAAAPADGAGVTSALSPRASSVYSHSHSFDEGRFDYGTEVSRSQGGIHIRGRPSRMHAPVHDDEENADRDAADADERKAAGGKRASRAFSAVGRESRSQRVAAIGAAAAAASAAAAAGTGATHGGGDSDDDENDVHCVLDSNAAQNAEAVAVLLADPEDAAAEALHSGRLAPAAGDALSLSIGEAIAASAAAGLPAPLNPVLHPHAHTSAPAPLRIPSVKAGPPIRQLDSNGAPSSGGGGKTEVNVELMPLPDSSSTLAVTRQRSRDRDPSSNGGGGASSNGGDVVPASPSVGTARPLQLGAVPVPGSVNHDTHLRTPPASAQRSASSPAQPLTPTWPSSGAAVGSGSGAGGSAALGGPISSPSANNLPSAKASPALGPQGGSNASGGSQHSSPMARERSISISTAVSSAPSSGGTGGAGGAGTGSGAAAMGSFQASSLRRGTGGTRVPFSPSSQVGKSPSLVPAAAQHMFARHPML